MKVIFQPECALGRRADNSGGFLLAHTAECFEIRRIFISAK